MYSAICLSGGVDRMITAHAWGADRLPVPTGGVRDTMSFLYLFSGHQCRALLNPSAEGHPAASSLHPIAFSRAVHRPRAKSCIPSSNVCSFSAA